jgi:fructosamine-3-kinase
VPDLPDAVVDRLRPYVGDIRRSAPVGGGCIANATRIETDAGRYFLKWGGGEAGQTFEAEAAGLRALREAASPLFVPDVIAAWDAGADAPGALLMEWIEPGRSDAAFWKGLGEGLATLHRTTSDDGRYGFERANFIGRTPQPNAWRASWPNFFRSQRLEPQIALARTRGGWRKSWDISAEQLLDRLGDELPERPPASLVHGDLWSGNAALLAPGCGAALFDPASHWADREVDLAMARLFGGFPPEFFAGYAQTWPLPEGADQRVAVYNLYHLLNHANLFGGGYWGQVQASIEHLLEAGPPG